MRKIISILALTILSLASMAQVENDEFQQGGFCTFDGQFFSIENGISFTLGGEAGFIIKDFRIGAYFDGMSNSAKITGIDSKPYNLRQSHGGFYLGYPFFNDHAFHLLTDIKLGYGASKLIDSNLDGHDKAGFIAITPSAAMEYSITDILKISLGINYQFHIKLKDAENYKQSILNQPSIYVAVTLGLF